ncbi:MAG TPA: Rv3235 family protein [Streptosporangiaceae bacterium]
MSDSQRNHRRRPLPDARAIRSSGVPEAAPPYDDEIPAAQRPPGNELLAEGAGRDFPGRGGLAPLVTGTWPSQFAQVLSEALAGSRPASQLTPWTTEQARTRISQLGRVLTTPSQPRIRRVIVSSPVQGVLEMTIIVHVGSRARAVAVRLERPSAEGVRSAVQPDPNARRRPSPPASGWVCTAIEAA